MTYHRENKSRGDGGKNYARRGSFGDRATDKPAMHSAICSQCDRECKVPFKPSGDRPVLCRDCFRGQEDTEPGEFVRKKFGQRSFGGKNSKNQMHKAVCDTCGKDCEVPFRPSGEKPIYCDRCFGKNSGKFIENNSNSNNMTKEQFGILNAKLDKILEALNS